MSLLTKKQIQKEAKRFIEHYLALLESQKEKQNSTELDEAITLESAFLEWSSQQPWGDSVKDYEAVLSEVYEQYKNLPELKAGDRKLVEKNQNRFEEVTRKFDEYVKKHWIRLKPDRPKDILAKWELRYATPMGRTYVIPLTLRQTGLFDSPKRSDRDKYIQSLINVVERSIRKRHKEAELAAVKKEKADHREEAEEIRKSAQRFKEDLLAIEGSLFYECMFNIWIALDLWIEDKGFKDWLLGEIVEKIDYHKIPPHYRFWASTYEQEVANANTKKKDAYVQLNEKIVKYQITVNLPLVHATLKKIAINALIDLFGKSMAQMPTDEEVSEPLKSLPQGVKFLKSEGDRNIYYNEEERQLVYRGQMTEQEYEELLHLSNDPDYMRVIENLYYNSNIQAPKDFSEGHITSKTTGKGVPIKFPDSDNKLIWMRDLKNLCRNERQVYILEIWSENGRDSTITKVVAEKFGTTDRTIRYDIEHLEKVLIEYFDRRIPK